MTSFLKRSGLRAALTIVLLLATATACRKLADILPTSPFKKEINVLIWSGYIPQEVIDDFEARSGIRVNIRFFTTNYELEEILLRNPGKYDLAMPSSFMAKQLLAEKLLAPFNLAALPNLEHIDKDVYNATFDPENHFVVPYIWGSTGIGYNANAVAGLPKSWGSLFKRSTSRKRRIALLDDARFTLGCALIYLGYSPSTTVESQVVEAGNVIKNLGDEIVYFDNENMSRLLSERRVDMAMAWSGDVTVAMLGNPDLGVKSNLKVRIALPMEGTIVFRDCFVLPTKSKRQASAEAFLNYLLDPRVAGRVTDYSYYATALKDSTPYVRRAIVNSASYYIHPYPDKNHFLEDNSNETQRIYAKVWADVKATIKAPAFDPDHPDL